MPPSVNTNKIYKLQTGSFVSGGIEVSDEALCGLKVLEYGEFISAPHCGKLLADLGADVIKVEQAGIGDGARRFGPFPQDIPDSEKSGLFLFLNTNKRGVTLNLDTEAGKIIFQQLIRWADVFVENQSPPDARKLGIDYKTLHDINPSLVVTSITYFGQTGPYSGFKGCDLISLHMSSEAFANPAYEVYDPEKNPPLKLPGHSGDFLGGVTGAICTMSAIFAQLAGGMGQHVDVSQQEALATMVCHEVGDYYDAGIQYLRDRKSRWEDSPKYACKDGYIMMNIPFQMWGRVVEMMGNPEWAKNPSFQTPIGLHENWSKVQPKIIEWMKEHTAAEVEKEAREKRIDVSIVHSAKEVVTNELFKARGFFVDIEHQMAGKIKLPGAYCKFSTTPPVVRRPPPLLGEHNFDVYCQLLGYTAENLVKLKQTRII